MELDDIRNEKENLEMYIQECIIQFKKTTGVEIKSIYIRNDYTIHGCDPYHPTIEIKTESI